MISALAFSDRLRPSPVPLLSMRDHPGTRLDREADAGRLALVRRGVYAPVQAWRELPPWDRYLARVHAVALTHPDAVFCLESAVALAGGPVFGEPPSVHILSAERTARENAGIRTHTTADAREIMNLGGVLVTSPVETVVDVARARHPAIGLAAADSVLHADPLASVEQLVARNESRRSTRGRRHARWPLHRADPGADGPLESVSRAVIEWLGFPPPVLQVTVTTDIGQFDVDFVWPEHGIGSEADGRIKYDGRYGDPGAVLWAEKQREDALRRHFRAFLRWGWDDLAEPMTLRRRLMDAGLRPIAPIRTDVLFSLRTALAGRPVS